jgi:hypothetical protein
MTTRAAAQWTESLRFRIRQDPITAGVLPASGTCPNRPPVTLTAQSAHAVLALVVRRHLPARAHIAFR